MSGGRRYRGKCTNRTLDKAYLSARAGAAIAGGFSKPKWIEFCEAMIDAGFSVSLYEARSTFSKYLTVRWVKGSPYKVRFSNHKPNRGRELEGDCDFFVGVTHTGVRTTEMAIQAVLEHFGKTDNRNTRSKDHEQQSQSG